METKFNYCLLMLAISTILQACKPNTKKTEPQDNFTSGTLVFAADESFAPIIDEELYIFKAAYPDADPVIKYTTENRVVNRLLNDSTRIIILSRQLDTVETGILNRRKLPPDVNKFAVDAVAVIVNQASNDTTTSVNELKAMLNGTAKTNKNIVFDNPNSSLVRYLKHLSGNENLKQKNITALKTSKEVIRYISTHNDAIGITGFSWLNDPDKDYADAVAKVKIVGIKDENNKKYPDTYFKPSQTTLVQKTYPLSRSLYVIDCTGRKGLGAGFASFLASDRGQRIILKSGLLPDSIPPREINITH